jgi:hypothetical protein
MTLPDQAIDQRQTTHHDGLPGFSARLALVRKNQFVNSGFLKKHLLRVDPLWVMQRGDFLAGDELTTVASAYWSVRRILREFIFRA